MEGPYILRVQQLQIRLQILRFGCYALRLAGILATSGTKGNRFISSAMRESGIVP